MEKSELKILPSRRAQGGGGLEVTARMKGALATTNPFLGFYYMFGDSYTKYTLLS